MGSNGPAPYPAKSENLCSHCGRDNAGIEDKTCSGCGAVVQHSPTSPPPPKKSVDASPVRSGLTPPPPPPAIRIMYR